MRSSVVALVSLSALVASTVSIAAPPDAASIGLASLPDAPDSKRVGERHRDRMTRIERGELQPSQLVPFQISKGTKIYEGTRFYDETGLVYRYPEAAAILTRACMDVSEDYETRYRESEALWALHFSQSAATPPGAGSVFLIFAAEQDELVAEAFVDLLQAFHAGECHG
ncbi:MAG: hypothetical protein AAFV53_06100 [Myxococcota bacterium]